MRKFLIIIVLVVVGLSCLTYAMPVYAAPKTRCSILGSPEYQNDRCSCGFWESCSCTAKYQDPAYYLQIVLDIIRYLGIIICIVMSAVDFFKTLFADDKDGYKKVITRSIKRLGFAVVIFFLPTLVMAVLDFVGVVNVRPCIEIVE